ncbi:cupin domain-containing protein [Legionella hackeliae]|nr:cupin domain-containing protein [Legionella hackeliae]
MNGKLNLATKEKLSHGVELCEIHLDENVPFRGSYFAVQPGCQTPLDAHQEKEIWIILKGTGILHCDNRIIPVNENDILYFKAHSTHQICNSGANNLLVCSIYW